MLLTGSRTESGSMDLCRSVKHLPILYKRGDKMTVLIVSKTTMQSGELKSVKNIAYDASTRVYTLTYENNTTQTYSGDLYYVTMLWTW